MICEELLMQRELPEIWNENLIDWQGRREEIKQLLQQEVYGFRPDEPEEITFSEMPDTRFNANFLAGKASVKRVEIKVKISGKEFVFPVCAVIPVGEKKHPFFIHINFRDYVPDLYLPTEEIVDNGFAAFSFCYKDVTSDDNDFDNGLAGVLYGGRERTGSECGKIAMWSWAASRVMDYCQTLDCLDFEKAAVVGHSRLGKTALFTGMMDERFRFVISNESGCTGASLSRGTDKETVDQICRKFPFWFAPNYQKYRELENEMPFDQHFMVASVAPRYVYVASAEGDPYCDPKSEYLSCCAASKVYEKLGMTGFVHPDRLPVNTDVLHEGTIGYHMRPGLHFFSRTDWNHYFRFVKIK